ncbi:2-methylcitrate dehydratase 2 [Halioglobus japonicus]|nr:2-methylcitrate dehydratase 2 [Halioglobus japonicus]
MLKTQELAEFIACYPRQGLPGDVVRIIKAATADYVGVTLAGAKSCVFQKAMALHCAAQGPASIWATGLSASISDAAFYNGIAAHSLELDDINTHMVAHPSNQLLPGLFALAEAEGKSGYDVIRAYQVGFEVGIIIANETHPALIQRGWFPVGVLGPVMQAAACACLLDLNQEQIANALGLAANTSAGLRENSGSEAKPIAAGHACASGVRASLLARAGIGASNTALEGRFGYLHLFGEVDSPSEEAGVNSAGSPVADYERFSLLESGLNFKPYPCCAANHSSIDCALELISSNPFSPDAIVGISITIPESARTILLHTRPTTADEAKFSVEYCIAQALLQREMGPAQFADAEVHSAPLQALMAKVTRHYRKNESSADELKRGHFPVTIELTLDNGQRISGGVEYAKGSAANPLTAEQLEQKFITCASVAASEENINSMLDALRRFDQMESIGELLGLVRA